MSVAFRATATVTNGTAGTSVVVARPSGTTNGDFLIAFIAQAGVAAVTAPAGWTFYGSQTTAGTVTLGVYYKKATSEPASWTWTLGSSSRNWGAVSAYTGVDPDAPIANTSSNTYPGAAGVFALSTYPLIWQFGMGVSAVASVRAATGVATTWSPNLGTERADLSTNAGAGTDIAGEIQDTTNGTSLDLSYTPTLTASQTQASAVVWALTLNPYWAPPLPSAAVSITVEAAMGADLTADPSTWVWTDLTSRLKGKAQVVRGQADQSQQTQPSTCTVFFDNTDGQLTPRNPNSTWYSTWTLGTPMRLKVVQAIASFIRCQGRVVSISPTWPAGNSGYALVEVQFAGLLYTLGQGSSLQSSMFRAISADLPVVYWSCEDGANAQSLSEASGKPPLWFVGGPPTLASGGPVGSAPLVTFTNTSTLHGIVPMAASITEWTVEVFANLSAAPAIPTPIIEWHTSGSIRRWRLTLFPSGGIDSIGIEGFDKTDTRLIDFETSFLSMYNTDLMMNVAARQNGGNIEYEFAFTSLTEVNGRAGGSIAGTIGPISRIDTPFAGQTGWVYGHFSAWDRSLDSNWGDLGFSHYIYMGGDTGLAADTRIVNIATAAGVTVNLRQDGTAHGTAEVMGPIPLATPLAVMRESELADLGLLTDGLNAGLDYLSKPYRFNRSVGLALDAARGHIKLPFEPIEDDQQLRNSVTVTRTGGSLATAIDSATITRGTYPDQPTLNLHDDSDLTNQAGMRLRLGTVAEMRAPVLTLDLRTKPELIRPWLERCDIGTRFTAVGLPAQYTPNGLDQIIEQYVETFDSATWTVKITGLPFAPWRVFVVEDLLLGRGDTSGSSLHTGVSALAVGSTDSWSVDTTAGPIWTTTATYPGDFPFDADCEGERVTVTAIANSSSPQTFTVTRGINKIVKAHLAGASISLWNPSGISF